MAVYPDDEAEMFFNDSIDGIFALYEVDTLAANTAISQESVQTFKLDMTTDKENSSDTKDNDMETFDQMYDDILATCTDDFFTVNLLQSVEPVSKDFSGDDSKLLYGQPNNKENNDMESFDQAYDDILATYTNDVFNVEPVLPELPKLLTTGHGQSFEYFDKSYDKVCAIYSVTLLEHGKRLEKVDSLKRDVQQAIIDIDDLELWKEPKNLGAFILSRMDLVEDILHVVRSESQCSGVNGHSDNQLPEAINDTFAVVNVPQDGSCFYSSLSVLVFGSCQYRLLFRFAALFTLVTKTSALKEYFVKTSGLEVTNNWFQYYAVKILSIGSKATRSMFPTIDNWADNVTVIATTYAMRRPVLIFRPFVNRKELLTEKCLEKVFQGAGMLIELVRCSQSVSNSYALNVYLKGSHYQALVKRNDAVLCPTDMQTRIFI